MSTASQVETAVHRHRTWLRSHPAELAWEVDLAERLGDHDKANHPSERHPHQFRVDDALDVLRAIDLRTIHLPSTRPSTGIENHLREALGVPLNDPMNIPLPPLPGRGLDGPDLGL
jgi:hypothetical protein